jgi:DNA helicase-2/ATP-dependent DNA helicase PcrA
MLTPESVLEGLTPPQREAATHVDGPLLVLAGAGSGKTRTITRRIAYLVACGIPAYNILAITFTNKAAGEMRDRVFSLLKTAGGQFGRGGVTVATFHALCARLLREFASAANLPKSFSIFDTADQSKAIKQAIKDVNISPDNFQPAQVLHTISNAKNKLQTPATYAAAAGGFFEKNVARAYARYEAILAENKAVDFDDLLLKMAVMLRDNEDVRRQLQERYQYILIDEYQDTNHAQFILAHMLAMNHKNICATGDPDQSIYGWRGANLNNILEFEQFYPNAKVVLLEQNYRSTKNILKAASALIANNTKRKKKDLWTDNEQGPKINLLKCNDERQEAAEIVSRIKAKHDNGGKGGGLGWDKMAIFYRVNSLSRVLEDALMKQGIPYQIARGTEFYARKEIKDVLAYLRVINNPDDNVSLERIANVPARALGETSVTKIATYAASRRISLLDAFRDAARIPDLTPRAKTAATKLAVLFENWRKLVEPSAGTQNAERGTQSPLDTQNSTLETPSEDPLFDPSLADAFANSEELSEADLAAEADAEAAHSEVRTQDSELRTSKPAFLLPGGIKGLMERVVREAGFEDELKKQDADGDDQGNDRLGNIGELINVAAEFDVQNPEGTLDDYLQQVTLVSDVDKIKDAGGAVTLMTLHAAKGLEFPYVSIAGMEDGLLPHARAVGFNASPDEMEEERRLAFVGITRAMKELTLSYARYRMIRGQTERTIASQFLNELPEETINEIDLTGESDTVGSLGYRDEASYGQRAQQERQRNAEAASQRRQAEAVAGEFKRGMLVRHPQFGLGRIEEIAAAGTMSKAVVRFQAAGQKTLILQYARLEKVDT